MNESLLWIEKYRPQTLEEFHGQEIIKKRIEALLKSGSLPHMMFAGPPGVGKSTLALIVARELFGESWRENFLELNASDARGIDVIRNEVKDFARTKALSGGLKIIFLDECLDYNTKVCIQKNDATSYLKIGEFIDNEKSAENIKIETIDGNGNRYFENVEKLIKIPHNYLNGFYELILHDGTQLKLTGNHEVLTSDGWKRTESLKRGELVLGMLPELVAPLSKLTAAQPVYYDLICLPLNVKRKEKKFEKSAEKAIIEVLASGDYITQKDIVVRSGVDKNKVGMALSPNGKLYTPLVKMGWIEKKWAGKEYVYNLTLPKAIAFERLKHHKRTERNDNEDYISSKLERLNLLSPIPTEKALILAKIVGHLFGDGTFSLKGTRLSFSGREEDVYRIKEDLESLGFHTYAKIREKHWKNGTCWEVQSFDKALISLMYSLGVPVGKKTDCIYSIPSWIKNADKEIKKAFVSSFFGSEATKPKFQKRTVKPIVIKQAKREDLIDYHYYYIRDWCVLLEEFGIQVDFKIESKIKNVRKDGTRTIDAGFWVKNSQQNILKFFETIGYSYCLYKENLAKDAILYLKWRLALGKAAYTFRPIPYFDAWQKQLKKEDCCFWYVTSVKAVNAPQYVYCFSVKNGKFIANNMVVHNCDALTREAQQALRRTMEMYANSTRFVLSCNFSSKIIDPIMSRCAVFRFKPLEEAELIKVIDNVASFEKLKIDAEAKAALVKVSHGDVRKVQNVLQSCASVNKTVSKEMIFEIVAAAQPADVRDIITLALRKDFIKARSKLLEVMVKQGISGLELVKQISEEVWNVDVPDTEKAKILEFCGDAEFRMVEGADEFLQLEAFLARLAR